MTVSARDPLKAYQAAVNQNLTGDLTGKIPVLPLVIPGERTVVLINMGQSNEAGHNTETYTPSSSRIHNFNYLNGGMYIAANPLLGCTTYGPGHGSFALRLADKLIAAGKADRVILAPMAINGASTKLWAGPIAYRIGVMGRRLSKACLMPPATTMFVLENLGESDAYLQIPQAIGTAKRRSIIAAFRAAGITCPYFVALCTHWGTRGIAGAAAVRAAQAAVVDNVSVFQGPDTDVIPTPSGTTPWLT